MRRSERTGGAYPAHLHESLAVHPKADVLLLLEEARRKLIHYCLRLRKGRTSSWRWAKAGREETTNP